MPAETINKPGTGIRSAWAVVGFLWIAQLLNYLDRQLVFSMFPVMERDLGFSGAQLGLLGSLFLWSYCACQGPAGRLADIVPRDRLVVASLLLWTTATFGTAMSHSAAGVLFWRSIMGVTESLYMPAALGLIAMLHPEATRSRAFAVHGTAQQVGSVAAGWYGGWSAEQFGWRSGFLLLSIAGLAYAALLRAVFRGLPDSKPEHRMAAVGSLREIFRSRCYIALAGAFTAFGTMLWTLYAWLPSFLYGHYPLTLAQSGFIATVYLQSSSAAGILGGGALADWLARRVRAARFYIVAAGVLGAAPFAYLTLAVHSLTVVKVGAAGFGFFAGLLLTNVFAAAFDVVSKRNYGLAAGILNAIPGLVSGSVVFVAGALRESFGITGIMRWVSITALVIALTLLMTVVRRFGRDRVALQAEA
jgi:MFS family permease